MVDRSYPIPSPRLSADIKGSTATFKVEQSWSRGKVYGAIKHWSGAEPELMHRRREHTLIMTLSGGTDLTGTKNAFKVRLASRTILRALETAWRSSRGPGSILASDASSTPPWQTILFR